MSCDINVSFSVGVCGGMVGSPADMINVRSASYSPCT